MLQCLMSMLYVTAFQLVKLLLLRSSYHFLFLLIERQSRQVVIVIVVLNKFDPLNGYFLLQEKGKELIVVLNKIDLISGELAAAWKNYFVTRYLCYFGSSVSSFRVLFVLETSQLKRSLRSKIGIGYISRRTIVPTKLENISVVSLFFPYRNPQPSFYLSNLFISSKVIHFFFCFLTNRLRHLFALFVTFRRKNVILGHQFTLIFRILEQVHAFTYFHAFCVQKYIKYFACQVSTTINAQVIFFFRYPGTHIVFFTSFPSYNLVGGVKENRRGMKIRKKKTQFSIVKVFILGFEYLKFLIPTCFDAMLFFNQSYIF